jgi:soluble lytic murein transglycosylase-like protein
VLRAIGWQESRLDTAAVGVNVDGSTDLGAFQINSRHLPLLARFGIDAGALRDGCTNAEVAAWHYRRQVERYGNTWTAVGAYHSATPARATAYADRIARILMAWSVLPGGPLPSGAPGAPPPSPTFASARPPVRLSSSETR